MNRIVQDWYNSDFYNKANIPPAKKPRKDNWVSDKEASMQNLSAYITKILERVYKYHIAYKTMLYEWEDRKMFASSNGGYINIKDLFSTVGINGLKVLGLIA